jgi:hypothetical protein
MDWPIFVAAGLLLLLALFALALTTASRPVGGSDAEMQALADLNRLQGPDGKPFFADEDAVWDLAERLEDPGLAEDLEAQRRNA